MAELNEASVQRPDSPNEQILRDFAKVENMKATIRNNEVLRRERDKQSKKASGFVIDPRTAEYVIMWDLVSGIALLFVAIVTPFEVAFMDAATSVLEPLFIVNRVIDVVFIIDLVIQFFLMVEVQVNEELVWTADRKEIAKNYLATWFPIDALSIAVSGFDYITIFGKPGSGVETLRILRILRTLRLVKLVKLVNGFRMLRRYEVKVAMNYALLSLVKCAVGTVLLSHWFACIWGLQASFQTSRLDTWMGSDPKYCYEDPTATSEDGATCAGPLALWVAALYFAVMTITSIGYGDISATAGNTAEQAVATVIMLLGSMVWGCVLGTIVSNLSSIDPERDAFTATMSELNRMMVREGLAAKMRIRLREYFHQTKHIRQAKQRTELLQLMSPTLRQDVSWEVNKAWLSKVWFLDGVALDFLTQLSLRLNPSVFAPGEVAPVGSLYIVNRGLALYGGAVFGRGRYWGEDMILTSSLQRQYMALAMSFLEVFVLQREDIFSVAASFPETQALLRKRAIRLACRRGVVAFSIYTRLQREARSSEGGSTALAPAALGPTQQLPKPANDTDFTASVMKSFGFTARQTPRQTPRPVISATPSVPMSDGSQLGDIKAMLGELRDNQARLREDVRLSQTDMKRDFSMILTKQGEQILRLLNEMREMRREMPSGAASPSSVRPPPQSPGLAA